MIFNDSSATRNLVLASILTLAIISIAFFLGQMKSSPLIPATTLIAADYQMESAIIMKMQQLHNNPASKPQPLEKEILPGIVMQLECSEQADKTWRFKASVKGQGIERNMQAIANSDNPEKIIFVR